MPPDELSPSQEIEHAAARTLVCSVLFVDLAEYSTRSVSAQWKLKQQFNTALLHVLRCVPESDRIVLDTGDGAAICFFGSPETAMFIAMDLRDHAQASAPPEGPTLQMRLGINLGPIRLIKDLNGQLNMIGDGINVAQRVMGFAAVGSILVSRSYYEVVSRLTEDYAQCLTYVGSRTDKHVREHDVYEVGASLPQRRVDVTAAGLTPTATASRPTSAAPSGGGRLPRWQRPLPLAAGVAVLVLGLALVWRAVHVGDGAGATQPEKITSPAAETPVASPRSTSSGAPQAGSPSPVPPTTAAAGAAPAAPGASVTPAPPAKTALADATVELRIEPWGEVFLDGRSQGVSPPLKRLRLPAGRHEIEIRNTNLPPLRRSVEAKPGATLTLQHRF